MLQVLDNAIIIWIVRLGSRTSESWAGLGQMAAVLESVFFSAEWRQLLGDALLRLPAAMVTHGANRASELRGSKFRAYSCVLNEEAAHPCVGQKVYQEQQQSVLLTTRKELTWTLGRTQTQSKPTVHSSNL